MYVLVIMTNIHVDNTMKESGFALTIEQKMVFGTV